ncbi:MAG: ABC transporter permease [Betaproteobacteria bacterium]|nr:ABC transporter permease [Betaproteobacteria bacterium]
MNLAFRDIRRNRLRFALTVLGVGMLLGVVIAMTGIYEGALTDALALPRGEHAALWVVQPRTFGPFAEPSRIPRDTRDLIRRMPGVAAAGAVTFQTVQSTTAAGRPVRLYLEGYEPGRPGGPPPLVAGHGLTESHYQVVVDASSHLKLGTRVLLGPYRDPYTVVGLTHGMVSSAGEPLAWVNLLDAQALQFDVPPALERRERAAGRTPPTTTDVNAVLVRLEPGVSALSVAHDISRWKHLAAVPEAREETYLTLFVIQKMQKQLGMFMTILTAVSAVIIALIIYTLTMDKVRSIATLKFIGAPDRTIVGLIVQQALTIGIMGYGIGLALIVLGKAYFPRRVQLEPFDLAVVLLIVIVVCLAGSVLSIRAALKVDPAEALASG